MRYAAALSASQLEPDLAMLSFGDQTEIGERGVTLSGGQKQRVSIARLAYAGADVNLLDDPLSAVDAHVGAALFDKCFKGVLASKTRVLVTNALQYLPQADQIVVMHAGAVREIGTFASLREKGTDFDALCATHEIHAEEEAAADSTKRVSLDKPRGRVSLDKPDKAAKSASPVDDKNLTGAEERSLGKIGSAVYITYARAAGSVAVLGVIAFTFSCEYGSKSFLDSWLGFWAADRFSWSAHKPTETHFYLLVYACVFVANSIFTYSRSLLFYFFSVRASKNMHLHMLQKVMRLPQSFFDSTPSGRVINRFSRDTEVLDSLLPMVLVQMTGCFFNILTTFVISASCLVLCMLACFLITFLRRAQSLSPLSGSSLRCLSSSSPTCPCSATTSLPAASCSALRVSRAVPSILTWVRRWQALPPYAPTAVPATS